MLPTISWPELVELVLVSYVAGVASTFLLFIWLEGKRRLKARKELTQTEPSQ